MPKKSCKDGFEKKLGSNYKKLLYCKLNGIGMLQYLQDLSRQSSRAPYRKGWKGKERKKSEKKIYVVLDGFKTE